MAFVLGSRLLGEKLEPHAPVAVGKRKKLQELKFIDIKAGKSGPMSHAIIWNPHLIIYHHHEQKTPGLLESSYTALLERALEVGAKDMTEPAPVPAAQPMAAPSDAAPGAAMAIANP